MRDLIKKRWYILLLVILPIGGFLFFQSQRSTTAKKESSYTVKRQNLKETLNFSGEIDASEKITLRFQTSGMLAWVGVKEGDAVKKYQTIASLDQQELQKNLQKYLNTYSKTRNDFDKASRDTYNNLVITDTIKRAIQDAQADLNNAVTDVELKSLAIKFASIWTPIDGIVTKINVPIPGVNIIPSQAEFEVVNPATVFFSATADQADVVKLKEGMVGELILDPFPQSTISAKIDKIAFTPKSGETGTVYSLKVQFPIRDTDTNFRLGMTGDVTFTIREKLNSLAVPTKFIKSSDGKKTLLVLRNGKKEKVAVELGETFDTDTEVLSGITENEVVYDQSK